VRGLPVPYAAGRISNTLRVIRLRATSKVCVVEVDFEGIMIPDSVRGLSAVLGLAVGTLSESE
jgi:hypothetical protein